MSMMNQFLSLARRFIKNRKGIAAVEFALIMPLLLTLFIGSVDVSQAISADRKLASSSGALGDLVSQSQQTLSAGMLNDYFTASEAMMMPFSGNQARFVVSLIGVDDDGQAQVDWSRGHNGGVPLVAGQTIALPTEITDIARGTYVVVAQGHYLYQPIGGFVLNASIPLTKEFFYMPRFGDRIALGS